MLTQTSNHPTEAANPLMTRIANGDEQAMSLFATRYGGRLYALGCRMLGDPSIAEDALQEALIKVWRFAPSWDSKKAAAFTWSYRVMMNTCNDILRKKQRGQKLETALLTDPTYATDDGLSKASKMAVADAVLKLPEKQKLSIVLTCWEGLSVAETADVLGVTLKSVESHLTRARKALREMLETEDDEPIRKTA